MRVEGLRCRVQGAGSEVLHFGLNVWFSWFRDFEVEGLRFRV